MTTKLAIKFAVFCRDLTLVAKYAFSQAPSHLEIKLQAPGTIIQPGTWMRRTYLWAWQWATAHYEHLLAKPITPGPNSPLTICLRTTSNSALVLMCSQMVTEASRNTVLAPSPHFSPHQRVKVWRIPPLARQTVNPSLSLRRSSPTLLPSEELHSLLPSSSSCPLLPRPPRFLP